MGRPSDQTADLLLALGALVLLLAVAAFWYLQWRDAPQVQDVAQASSASQ